jgi:hypothetical protein
VGSRLPVWQKVKVKMAVGREFFGAKFVLVMFHVKHLGIGALFSLR